MVRVKEGAAQVWLGCTRCGERFGQPFGAVTSQVCEGCLASMAAAFRATEGTDEEIAAAASELLRTVYGFLVEEGA